MVSNKHLMGSDAQLVWKCPFVPTSWAGSFDP